MNSASGEMTLRDYGRVVTRRRWIIAGTIMIAVLASLLVSFLSDSVYQGEAQVLITGNDSGTLGQRGGTSSSDRERTVRTAVELIESDDVRSRVQEALELDEPPPKVNASVTNEADIVSLTVRSTDPEEAQTLADAYVEEFIASRRDDAVRALSDAGDELQARIADLQEQIDEMSQFDERRETVITQQQSLQRTLSELQTDAALQTGGVSRVSDAEFPNDPVAPQPIRSAVLAAAVGLIVGLAAAFVREHLDDSVNDVDDLVAASGMPVLAAVPKWPASGRPITVAQPFHRASEAFRALRTSVQIASVEHPAKIVQVTSPAPGEGKTVTVCNLAIVLAQAGQRVVVVDGDQRVPGVHQLFALSPSPGLVDVVQGTPLDTVIQQAQIDDHHQVDIVAAGQFSSHPSETVSGEPMRTLLHDLASRYDVVLVDSPPVLPVADAVSIARSVDGVIVVTQAGRSKQRNVSATITQLTRVTAPVIGLVLDRAPTTSIGDDFEAYSTAARRRAGKT